jgi:hypothetical protein
MPVDFQQIRTRVRRMGEQAPERKKALDEKKEQARNLLQENSRELDKLRELVQRAAAVNNGLRCALPVHEALAASFSAPSIAAPYHVLAADGSQISPSHHDAVTFAVVNAGAIRMAPGQSSAPEEFVETEMLVDDDLQSNGYPITEEWVMLQRDLRERQLLLRLAQKEQGPVVALTDGPLEIYGEPKEDPTFQKPFDDYLTTLRTLSGLGAAVAGYVDKPGADLVVRLLELLLLPSDNLDQAGRQRPLAGIRDIDLLGSVIKPGERSAVFALQSRSSTRFTGELELHFFYLNVGREPDPRLARVEIPRWVAESTELTGLLHACLLEQCAQMGAQPYPYILHRSHEIAVVEFEEKDQIERMIQAELAQHGIFAGDSSAKQGNKELGKRKRYGQ